MKEMEEMRDKKEERGEKRRGERLLARAWAERRKGFLNGR
jgi:hypothetical protein